MAEETKTTSLLEEEAPPLPVLKRTKRVMSEKQLEALTKGRENRWKRHREQEQSERDRVLREGEEQKCQNTEEKKQLVKNKKTESVSEEKHSSKRAKWGVVHRDQQRQELQRLQEEKENTYPSASSPEESSSEEEKERNKSVYEAFLQTFMQPPTHARSGVLFL